MNAMSVNTERDALKSGNGINIYICPLANVAFLCFKWWWKTNNIIIYLYYWECSLVCLEFEKHEKYHLLHHTKNETPW